MITLIFCGDIMVCPYLKRYTEEFDRANVPYEVLFWNRAGRDLTVPHNHYFFDSVCDDADSKTKKLKGFLGFRNWIASHLRSHKTDGLVLLSTLTGILLFDKLGKYQNKYIFDIRDYSFEQYGLFRFFEKSVIKKSYFTAISSKGFKAFLPDHDYVIAHNFNRSEMIEMPKFEKSSGVINFVWNGTVRYFDFQKRYIDALANDDRFMMIYHGKGEHLERFRQYCKDRAIKNVEFTGPYDNSKKYALLENAHILNNCYGGNYGDKLKYAVSNRFYDGLIYRIPQVVEEGGYKASLVEAYGVGLPKDADTSFADQLYHYYQNIDAEAFEANCEKAVADVIREDDVYIAQIRGFCAELLKEQPGK